MRTGLQKFLGSTIDYYGKLSAQLPIPRLRVVYAKAGTLPAACVVRDEQIIDHMLYWMSLHSELEGHYLLLSLTVRQRVPAWLRCKHAANGVRGTLTK